MCGRYVLHSDPADLARYFDTANPVPNFAPVRNVAPTMDRPVVRRHPEGGARHLDVLRWGLVPRWAKDATGAARMINARAEGVAEKPSFRDAFARRRCLVPADAFYEWREDGTGTKQPYAAALSSGEPMALAGLWEGWKNPESGEWLRTYTVVTTDANEKMRPLHHRMPVLLARENWPAWLGEEAATRDDLLTLLRPCPEDWLSVWPVDKRVNKVREDDAGLLDRVEGVAPLPGLDDPSPFASGKMALA